MKTTTAKPTPGEWHVDGSDVWNATNDVCVLDAATIYGPRNAEEAKANAELTAEAGTVYHETGLTPREMQETITEAREALETLKCRKKAYDAAAKMAESESDRQWLGGTAEGLSLAIDTLAKLTPKPGPWDGINADEFVRSVRDGSYQPKDLKTIIIEPEEESR